MANVEKLSVALTPELAQTVRDVVAHGEYASSSEVIREALREWKLKRIVQEQEIAALRRQWQQGVDSGPGQYDSMAAIKAAARRRLEETDGQ